MSDFERAGDLADPIPYDWQKFNWGDGTVTGSLADLPCMEDYLPQDLEQDVKTT